MPRRDDLGTIMIVGSGPIVIGQACEFDYSATQGCKALKEEGYRLVLLNSNPATVMTDPEMSDRTYVEPMTAEVAARIMELELVDALLPTLGGQTALNLAMELHGRGDLDRLGVELIGSDPDVIEIAESRQRFRETMASLGLEVPASGLAESVAEAMECVESFPAIVRPSYTLGGTGGGVARCRADLVTLARRGLAASPIHQILVEESLVGWKEMELEMMRDLADNAIIVCGIENVDPMGVHTGDSVTVAPIQTLTDAEYQAMRDDALKVARAVGLNGGCNIQFAVEPSTGRRVVIEMNPRVSRSSALASKATGFPIARVAAKLAVGYTLGELKNGITGKSACFEPALDYCVVKAPRFNFEKFAGASPVLGLEMRAVGETMALGGNFREALQKSLRGLETGQDGIEAARGVFAGPPGSPGAEARLAFLRRDLAHPKPDRLPNLYEALRLGLGEEEAASITGLDAWFVSQLSILLAAEREAGGEFASLVSRGIAPPAALWRRLKSHGFSDSALARIVNRARPGTATAELVTGLRERAGVRPHFRMVDTCAGEFTATTPYYYSSYDSPAPPPAPGVRPAGRHRVMILGGGPNRIGQGIEFDYCCVKASQAFEAMGLETIMVNSNPETVSTDYDAVGRLYFEPVTLEDVLEVLHLERPDGVVVQLGGQTPLNLAPALQKRGAPIWGTAPESILTAEDRHGWNALVERLGLKQPPGAVAGSAAEALEVAAAIGYPVIARPSFVLGGRAMRIIDSEEELRRYVADLSASGTDFGPASRILVDKFLGDAVEVDVDALADGAKVTIAAIMEHIEPAGVHSGDSGCSIPPFTLSDGVQAKIREQTEALGVALGVKGLMNIQFAVHEGEVYVLEANPRASRTAPFVAKATGRPLIESAAKIMAGDTIERTGYTPRQGQDYFAVKEAVLPWTRFIGAVLDLGPEMHSTGEVMGVDRSFGLAFLKAQSAAGMLIRDGGDVVLTVSDRHKEAVVPLAVELASLGYDLHATPGTQKVLERAGIRAGRLYKLGAGSPDLIEFIREGAVRLLVNTISGPASARDATFIRAEAIAHGIPLVTTVAGLQATVEGLKQTRLHQWRLSPLQDYHR